MDLKGGELKEIKNFSELDENLDKYREFTDEHNSETEYRGDNGENIAEKLNTLEPSLEESHDAKQRAVYEFSDDAQRAIDEQLEDQHSLENLADDMNQDLGEKGEMEAQNINTIQSAFAAADAGGFQKDILNDFVNENQQNIEQIKEYQNQIIDTTDHMIEKNNQAFESLNNAIKSIS